MHNRIGAVFSQDGVNSFKIQNIAVFERAPSDKATMSVNKIIVHNGLVSGLLQGFTCMRTDVSGTARNQY
jgi:hypothetical protein